MRDFDHDYMNGVIRRLSGLRSDARPVWGRMTPAVMVQHLVDAVRLSMGRSGAVPDHSNWLFRNVLGPLLLNGYLRMPRNVRLPEALAPRPSTAHDDVETLHALLEEYLAMVQAGELVPQPHPYFGSIGVDGWAKAHVVHFEHHLRQFGV